MSIANNTDRLNILKELINALPEPSSGESGDSSGLNASYGMVSANKLSQVTITHGLGKIPSFVCFCSLDRLYSSDNQVITHTFDQFNLNGNNQVTICGIKNGSIVSTSGPVANSLFEANASIAIIKSGSLDLPFSGDYFWVAFGDKL